MTYTVDKSKMAYQVWVVADDEIYLEAETYFRYNAMRIACNHVFPCFIYEKEIDYISRFYDSESVIERDGLLELIRKANDT